MVLVVETPDGRDGKAQQHRRWPRNSARKISLDANLAHLFSVLTFDLGSIRLTPCLLIAIRRVSG